MIGCFRTRVRKQPIIALYFESETVLKFYNLEASSLVLVKMIAKLESTQSNAYQKLRPSTELRNSHKQWEAHTTMNHQQKNHHQPKLL